MKTDTFLKRAQANIKEATWIQMVMAISLALNVVLAFAAVNREIVIHLPPAASADDLVIQEASASQETKIAHGLYLAGLLGNVSSNNAGFVETAVGRFVTPRAYKAYLNDVQTEALKIRDEQLTTHFQATDAQYDTKKDLVIISGLLTTRGVTAVEQRNYRTFEFRFITRNHQTLLDEMAIKDTHSRLSAGN